MGRREGRRPPPSICVAVPEPEPERLQQDPEVEPHRPALDVIEVVLDALLNRRVAAPAVDLGPARDPGLHLVAEHIAWHAPPELLDQAPALGPRTTLHAPPQSESPDQNRKAHV